LHHRKDFQQLSFFYKILGVFPLGSDAPLVPSKAEDEKLISYEIAAGKEYELRLYHYHPEKSPTKEGLVFRSAREGIDFLTNPRMVVDSPYDLKRLRFVVDPAFTRNAVSLSVDRIPDVSKEEFGRWEFDVLLRILRPRMAKIFAGFGIGIVLAGPQVVSAWLSPTLGDTNRWIVSGIAMFSGLTVGLFAVFRIKKPL
jgi:hypothetical protein